MNDKPEDNIATIKQGKTPIDTVSNQLVDTERKKLMEDLKKGYSEVSAAKTVLTQAVQKVLNIQDSISSLDKNKLDIKELADILGIE
jgi:hypothetical protein